MTHYVGEARGLAARTKLSLLAQCLRFHENGGRGPTKSHGLVQAQPFLIARNARSFNEIGGT